MRALIPGRAIPLLATAAAVLRAIAVEADVPAAVATAAGLPPIDATTSLLVVAPHPDDETLCCAGLIQRVLQAGGQASVVWITSGDAERTGLLALTRWFIGGAARARELGERRMAEARAATTLLGVPAGRQLFLGYPDGGVRALLGENRALPYTSPATAAAAVPYPAALYPGHAHTGDNLARDLAAVLARTQPTLVLAPSPHDSHPDHRAAGLLTIAVSAEHAGRAQLRFWIVHGGEGWPSPRELSPGIPLTPAPLERGLAPAAFALAPAEEDRKLLALQAYRSQLQSMSPFLLAFVRTCELYWARAPAGSP